MTIENLSVKVFWKNSSSEFVGEWENKIMTETIDGAFHDVLI